MQLELYLAERKTGSCCIIQVTVSPYHTEFSGVFLKLINIYIDWSLLSCDYSHRKN